MQKGIELIISEYISIRPVERRDMFPPNDVPFLFISDSNIQDEVNVKEHSPEWPPHIYLKGTNFYKNHSQLEEGDRVRISVIEPMKKYRLEIVE